MDVQQVSGSKSKDNGSDLGSNQESDSAVERGNGMQAEVDADLNALVAKQKSQAAIDLKEGADLVTEHGDVGRAGSYRIGWIVKG